MIKHQVFAGTTSCKGLCKWLTSSMPAIFHYWLRLKRSVAHATRGRDGRQKCRERGYYNLHRHLNNSLFHTLPPFLRYSRGDRYLSHNSHHTQVPVPVTNWKPLDFHIPVCSKKINDLSPWLLALPSVQLFSNAKAKIRTYSRTSKFSTQKNDQ